MIPYGCCDIQMKERGRRLGILISVFFLATILVVENRNDNRGDYEGADSFQYDDENIRITYRNQSIHSIPSLQLEGPFVVEPPLPEGVWVANENMQFPGRVIDSYQNRSCALSPSYGILCWEIVPSGIEMEVELKNNNRIFVGVSVGRSHSCAISDFGSGNSILCWGSNLQGQQGNLTQAFPSVAEEIFHPTGLLWENIEAGAEHTCALDEDGQIYCWGQGRYGQLGYGGWEAKFSPTKVQFEQYSEIASGESKIVSIMSGSYHNCAISSSGNMYCWGWNGFGQLGSGTDYDKSSPSRVIFPGDFSTDDLSIGLTHSCALDREKKSSYCWGNNRFGNIDASGTKNIFEPFQLFNKTNVEFLSAGSGHTCSSHEYGNLSCMGDGIDVGAIDGANVQFLSSGEDFICIVWINNSVSCHGRDIEWNLNDVSSEFMSMKVVSSIRAGSVMGIPQQNFSSIHRISEIGEDGYSSEFSILIEFGEDSDGDGWKDYDEKDCGKDPFDRSSFPSDWDDDGFCDSNDWDDDGDYVADVYDIFPYDVNEWKDDDRDGIGSNADSIEFTGAMVGAFITLLVLLSLISLELNYTFNIMERIFEKI